MGSGVSTIISQNTLKKNVPAIEVPSFKVVLVGDPYVGKTAIFLRYLKEQFDYSYQPTVNVNIGNITKKVAKPYETLVTFTLWDLPGRDEIDLRRSYYQDIDAAIVVVDLLDESSIQMAGTWKQDILNNCSYTSDTGKQLEKNMKDKMQLPVLLIGNKMDNLNSDLDNSLKCIQILEDIAEQHNFIGGVAISACNSYGGVHAAFKSLAIYLLERLIQNTVDKTVKHYDIEDHFSMLNQQEHFKNNFINSDEYMYQPLQLCKIEELDEIFKVCDRQLKSLELCCVVYIMATKSFKNSCCISGVTDSSKSSIEECISSLKKLLQGNSEEEILIGHEEASCVRLELSENKREIPGPLKKVLELYNGEVCKASKCILSQCPPLKVRISDTLSTIFDLKRSSEEKVIALGFDKKQIKICLQVIDENICHIEETLCLADESMRATADQVRKVKAAMTW